MPAPSVSVVIPTHGRPAYLRVALDSVLGQARAVGAQVLVVIDGPDPASEAVARELGAEVVVHDAQQGLNAARNTAIDHTDGELIAFLDDDVRVHDGWLEALIAGAAANPDVDCFAGPIVARIEDHAFPMCGREGAPVTALDLGASDVEAPTRLGGEHGHPPQRLAAASGASTPTTSCTATSRSGRTACAPPTARASATWPGPGSTTAAPVTTRACVRSCAPRATAAAPAAATTSTSSARPRWPASCGCWPAASPTARCTAAPTAPSWPPTRSAACEIALDPPPDPATPDFLAGRSGTVGGRRGRLRALTDRALDVLALPARARLRLLARRTPRRHVLVLEVVRDQHRAIVDAQGRELQRSRHHVDRAVAPPGERGKFENLNALLADRAAGRRRLAAAARRRRRAAAPASSTTCWPPPSAWT